MRRSWFTLIHTLKLTRCNTPTHTHAHTLTHTLGETDAHTHTRWNKLTHAHTQTRTQTHTHTWWGHQPWCSSFLRELGVDADFLHWFSPRISRLNFWFPSTKSFASPLMSSPKNLRTFLYFGCRPCGSITRLKGSRGKQTGRQTDIGIKEIQRDIHSIFFLIWSKSRRQTNRQMDGQINRWVTLGGTENPFIRSLNFLISSLKSVSSDFSGLT